MRDLKNWLHVPKTVTAFLDLRLSVCFDSLPLQTPCCIVCSGVTVFEALQKRKGDKRRRQRNSDAGDVDGYLGPWGKFVDEQTIMKPSEVDWMSQLLH